MKEKGQVHLSLHIFIKNQVWTRKSIVPVKKQNCDSYAEKETFLFESLLPGLTELVSPFLMTKLAALDLSLQLPFVHSLLVSYW